MLYGKHRWTLRRPGHDFRASAHYLLQVAICVFWCGAAAAEFGSTDSTNLRNCRRLLSEIVYGDPDTADSPDAVTSFDKLSDIWEVLRYADFPGMKDDLDAINTYTENSYYRLVNIESSTASAATALAVISDRLEVGVSVGVTNDLVTIISNGVANALAAVPLAYAAATNVVDMGVVTNLATYLFSFQDVADWGDFSSFPYYELLFAYFHQMWGPDELFDVDSFQAMWANSPLGFMLYLYQSALFRSDLGSTGLSSFDKTWGVWHKGEYFAMPSPDYTIFDAYNTLGLGVLTNQVASLLSVARANTNLLTQILSILDNSDFGLEAIATAVSTSSVALGTSGAAALDHSANYDLPQWEPTYSREVDSNTNVYEFDDAMKTMTQALFGDTTNQTGSLASEIGKIQPGGDLSLSFDFSGFNLGQSLQNFAPWSVSTSFAGLEEFKNFFKTLSRYMFYILDLCLVIIGCRRIQRAIIGDVGIL